MIQESMKTLGHPLVKFNSQGSSMLTFVVQKIELMILKKVFHARISTSVLLFSLNSPSRFVKIAKCKSYLIVNKQSGIKYYQNIKQGKFFP